MSNTKPSIWCPGISNGLSLSRGLKCYMPMWEGGGNTAMDVTPNSNNGVLTTGAAFVPGRYGSAVAFDGANNNHIAIPTGFDYPEITIACRIRQDDTTTFARIFCTPSANTYEYGLVVALNGTKFYVFNRGGITGGSSNLTALTYTVGGWHTVIQRSGASGIPTTDINGARVAFVAGSGLSDRAGNFRIGNRQDEGSDWEGLIDWFAVWDRQLSDVEALSLYLDPYDIIKPPSLRSYFYATAPAGGATVDVATAPAVATGLAATPAIAVDAGVAPDVSAGLATTLTVAAEVGIAPAVATGLAVTPSVGVTVGTAPAAATGLAINLSAVLDTGIAPATATGLECTPSIDVQLGVAPAVATGLTISLTAALDVGIAPAVAAGLGATPVLPGGSAVFLTAFLLMRKRR